MNEIHIPEYQTGHFFEMKENPFCCLGVIRDRFLGETNFCRKKAGRETWTNHYESIIWMWSRILRHFAMKSIMVQELNENSLATRILDSSSHPQPLKSLSHQCFSTNKTLLKTFIFHKKKPKGWPFVKFRAARCEISLEHLRLRWSSALRCSPDDWDFSIWIPGRGRYCWCFGNPAVEVDIFKVSCIPGCAGFLSINSICEMNPPVFRLICLFNCSLYLGENSRFC